MDYRRIIEEIEKAAPVETAEPWDSVGLMIEPADPEVGRVLLALDATPDVALEAAEKGCGLVVTHHPLFFRPVERWTGDTFEGRTALLFARKGIGLYAAHTNLDASPEGTWAALIDLLGFPKGEALPGFACGALTVLPEAVGSGALKELLRERTGSGRLTSVGPVPDAVSRIAVATGSGSDAIPYAQAAGADLLITGEMKYHDALPASYGPLWILEAGHHETERPVLAYLKKHLQTRLDGLQSRVDILLSEREKTPENA